MNPAERILRKLIEQHKTPCVQYSIFNNDDLIFQFADGFANVSHQSNVNEATAFHAYSVTKTFTALAILQLAEQGKLDIDMPAKNYLPAFVYPENITIKHLLTHAAGIPNPIPISWIHLEEDHSKFDANNFFKNNF